MTDTQLTTNDSLRVFDAKTTDETIAIMKEEQAEAQREKILNSMTPAFREKLNFFENWLRKEARHVLRSRYELGLVALELYEDEKKNGGKLYGKNAIGRICKILHWDDGLIRWAMRFVQTYSWEDMERLCSVILPTGEPITWSHMRCLIPIKDAGERQALLERTVTEGWSCTELACQIVEGRAKPVRAPLDFDGSVVQQLKSAEQWDRQHSKVWGQQNTSLVAQAVKLAPDEVTEERLFKAKELAHQLRFVADQVVKQAEVAEQVVREFERVLRERQQIG